MTPAEQFLNMSRDLNFITDTLGTLFPNPKDSPQRRRFFLQAAHELVAQAKYESDPLTPLLTHFINVYEDSKG